MFIVLKIFQSESDRKRRLEREEKKLRDKAATGGFAPIQWSKSNDIESDKID